MRNRVRNAITAVGRALLAPVLAIADSRDEWNVIIGLGLLTVALWPQFGRGALAIPGFVLIWIALPARAGFVLREQPADAKKEIS